ncbi:MAG: glycoside hydrolase family 3 C-terminal domain-containing protein, partial [Bacteroidales bacterium]|nr:glycoside hydrolase family 3 C-terminal domain-containing protein [Bacteroidales bacterium]
LNKSHHQDCEGGDRLSFDLPFAQNELLDKLIATNANTGVVLVSGNAVAMPWLNKVDGLIQTWYNGSEAGNALADVISGDVSPSGKLPFSYPKVLTDNAAHHFGQLSYPGDSIDQYYKEDILVGYRWHDTQKIKPLFAFGYGLSYTDMALSDISMDKKDYSSEETLKVNCTITNNGSQKGAEVIQVYVGKSKSKVERALKELKGFDKVYLEAGQQQQVQIEIPISDLKYYDETMSDWNLEKGAYVVYIGNSSDHIIKKQTVTIK